MNCIIIAIADKKATLVTIENLFRTMFKTFRQNHRAERALTTTIGSVRERIVSDDEYNEIQNFIISFRRDNRRLFTDVKKVEQDLLTLRNEIVVLEEMLQDEVDDYHDWIGFEIDSSD